MRKGLSDLFAFGKVISAALLICGYIVFGLILGQKLVARGYPSVTTILLAAAGALVGVWQSWLWLRQVWKQTK